ncbi:hypothetical protein QAD02_002423 [Eretmocerus hayati]|uniref:Uncharacterized protein n=1 Tax=Eretmocerus hayati TaxID=131215 RepID=A0ACC2NLJ5_9HYME|nr:hypothetical protein QAD02_002423 [Eretmocerus hayati]
MFGGMPDSVAYRTRQTAIEAESIESNGNLVIEQFGESTSLLPSNNAEHSEIVCPEKILFEVEADSISPLVSQASSNRNIDPCSATTWKEKITPRNSELVVLEARNKNLESESTSGEDFEELIDGSGRFSEKLQNLLKVVLFPASGMSVEKVLNMLQVIYLRHKISKEARFAILELIKVLAGPDYQNLNLSKYYVTKFNKSIDENKTYTFYCTDCFKVISEPLLRKNFTKNVSGKCQDCEKVFQFSTKDNNFYINMNIESQLRNLFLKMN